MSEVYLCNMLLSSVSLTVIVFDLLTIIIYQCLRLPHVFLASKVYYLGVIIPLIISLPTDPPSLPSNWFIEINIMLVIP